MEEEECGKELSRLIWLPLLRRFAAKTNSKRDSKRDTGCTGKYSKGKAICACACLYACMWVVCVSTQLFLRRKGKNGMFLNGTELSSGKGP